MPVLESEKRKAKSEKQQLKTQNIGSPKGGTPIFCIFRFAFFVALALSPLTVQAQIPLEVRIGGAVGEAGRFVVQDLGQYLSILYNYLIGIAGVLATVMIVIGGFRWLLAAGDPGKIGAAKETIGSAVIGLALALGSFLILNTINPQLVELRLPYVPTVSPQNFVFSNRCSDPKFAESERFLLARPTRRPGEPVPPYAPPPTSTSTFTLTKAGTQCGNEYYYQSGGSLTCQGDTCSPGNACSFDTVTGGFSCKPRVIGGIISFEDDRYLDNNIQLSVLCNDGERDVIKDINADEPDLVRKKQRYEIAFTKEELEDSIEDCDAGVKGLYLMSPDVNEDPSVLRLLVTGGEGAGTGAAVGAAAGCAAGAPFGGVGCLVGAGIGAIIGATTANDDTYYMGKGACAQNGGAEPFFFTVDTEVPEGQPGHFIAYPRSPTESVKASRFLKDIAEKSGAAFWSLEEMRAAVSSASPQPIDCDLDMNYSRYPAQ